MAESFIFIPVFRKFPLNLPRSPLYFRRKEDLLLLSAIRGSVAIHENHGMIYSMGNV